MGNKIIEYLSEIERQITDLEQTHKRQRKTELLLAFRGESKDYGRTKLMPSLFRDTSFVEKEEHLFDLACDYGLVDITRKNIEKAIASQHYVSISRMLDISFNVATSLYFACSSEKDEDGFVYVFGFPEYFSPHSTFIESFYKDILESKKTITYYKNFKVFTHSYSNERIKAQSGGFIFFPGDSFSPINEAYYRQVKIKASDKNEILIGLEKLFHVNKVKLFPEKENIGLEIREKFKSEKFINKELSVESEIESDFKRISYELSVFKMKDKKRKLRYLRKEKNDLLVYLKGQIQDEKMEKFNELEDKIMKWFEFYKRVV